MNAGRHGRVASASFSEVQYYSMLAHLMNPIPLKAEQRNLAPLAPVLRGEGLGVRGEPRVHRSSRTLIPSPSPSGEKGARILTPGRLMNPVRLKADG